MSVAQQPHYWQYNEDDGLASSTIYYLYQGDDGVIWCGTEKGLSSFDGQKIKNYPFEDETPRSINRIIKDRNGTIWCVGFRGEAFQVINGKLKKWNLPKQKERKVYDINITSKKNINILS